MCIQILVCKCSLECKLEILVEQNLIQVRKIALSPQARVIVLWEIIRQREWYQEIYPYMVAFRTYNMKLSKPISGFVKLCKMRNLHSEGKWLCQCTAHHDLEENGTRTRLIPFTVLELHQLNRKVFWFFWWNQMKSAFFWNTNIFALVELQTLNFNTTLRFIWGWCVQNFVWKFSLRDEIWLPM